MSGAWRNATSSLLLREDEEARASARARIAAFDLNDTLVTSKSGVPGYQLTLSDWQYYNEDVAPKLRSLHSQGFKLVIFSNQGNIRTALAGKRAQTVKAYVDAFLRDVAAPVQVFLATQNDCFRKPGVGMWEYLEQRANGGVAVDRSQSFYVGDAAGGPGEHSAADSEFAKALAVKFIHVRDFFGPASETALHVTSGVGLKRATELGEAGPGKAPRFAASRTGGSVALSDSDEKNTDSWPVHLADNRLVPPVILVLVGAPGSGKSTFAGRLGPEAPAATRRTSASTSTGDLGSHSASCWRRVCQDILKSKEACLRSARACLEDGLSVVIDRTNVDAEQRAHWVELARQTGAACHCLLLDVAAAECCRRVVQRPTHEGSLVGYGAQSVVMRLFSELRPVRGNEGFQRVRVVHNDSDINEELQHYSSGTSTGRNAKTVISASEDSLEKCVVNIDSDTEACQIDKNTSLKDEPVRSLVALGFNEADCRAALMATAGDVNGAAERLLGDRLFGD